MKLLKGAKWDMSKLRFSVKAQTFKLRTYANLLKRAGKIQDIAFPMRLLGKARWLKFLAIIPVVGIGLNIYYAKEAFSKGDNIVGVGNVVGTVFDPVDIATCVFEVARDNPPGPDAWRYENTKQIHYPQQ